MRPRSILFYFIIINIASTFSIASGNGGSERQRQIEELQEKLQSKRFHHEQLLKKEKDQLEKLRSLEEQTALSGQLLLKIKRELNKLDSNIKKSRSSLLNANSELAAKKQTLYKRMKYIYKHGMRLGWFGFLSSSNPTEAMAALRNISLIMEYDKKLVASLEILSNQISETVIVLEREDRQLADFKKEYEDEIEFRKTALSTLKQLIIEIREDRSDIQTAIGEIEKDNSSIAEIFKNLDSEPTDNNSLELPGLEGRRGDLVWPIQGKIVKSFGTKKDKRGIKLTNPGIDIKTAISSKVKAAATGKAIYVNWLRGYGQFVILDHGRGYYTLYANLSDIYIEAGDGVKAGEAIAEVGDWGSFEGSQLHFELRYKKDPLDPVKWLR